MISEATMNDVKAAIAVEIARVFDRKKRVGYVAQMLQIEEDEARRLIARGRRIARERVKAA